MNKLPQTILWIQDAPNSHETILSVDEVQIKSGTSKYISIFDKLIARDIEKYKVLTSSVKRLTEYSKGKKKGTFLSGYFLETDGSNRRICYRALIIDAKDREEECFLLEKEARLYECHISEEDRIALKKKSKSFVLILLLIFIIICLWIYLNLKMF